MTAKLKELKDTVVETLESQGVLGKMRGRSGTYGDNRSLKKLQESDEGVVISNFREYSLRLVRVALELIREFLEFYGLNFTLSVFIPEADLYGGRGALAKNLSLNGSQSSSSLLGDLLHQTQKKLMTTSGPGPAATATASIVSRPDPAIEKMRRDQEEKEKREKEERAKKGLSVLDAPPLSRPALMKNTPSIPLAKSEPPKEPVKQPPALKAVVAHKPPEPLKTGLSAGLSSLRGLPPPAQASRAKATSLDSSIDDDEEETNRLKQGIDKKMANLNMNKKKEESSEEEVSEEENYDDDEYESEAFESGDNGEVTEDEAGGLSEDSEKYDVVELCDKP
ncbi:hypothetical protein PROFUN_00736 [Planoprotostelium fungivorum]|uniref:FGFR1 oncogene partner (FOP) N-terminal dimerisation domain-containing protein n=1 Tax=Planoprotostelium fungivorum TaxID=1890364 RepID=A0A2P6NU80_9EUKA|nr:hypothetical protein PROFUN_00736 [Planoprotostelium fungivorum]